MSQARPTTGGTRVFLAGERFGALAALLADTDEPFPPAVALGEAMGYTSSTTGRPKGVRPYWPAEATS